MQEEVGDKPGKPAKERWRALAGQLYARVDWFKRGVVVLAAGVSPTDEMATSDKIVVSQGRTLHFQSSSTYALLKQKMRKKKGSPPKPPLAGFDFVEPAFNRVQELMNVLTACRSYDGAIIQTTPYVRLSNPKLSDEFFVPLILKGRYGVSGRFKKIGMYVYPWMTSELDKLSFGNSRSASPFSSTRTFSEPSRGERLSVSPPSSMDIGSSSFSAEVGSSSDDGLSSSPLSSGEPDFLALRSDEINIFVTAGCLFGASFQAVDQKGATFPVIQHKIPFMPGEKIEGLLVDQHFHPYEIAQFDFLKKMALLIKVVSPDSRGTDRKLIYHLPDYDYVLYGLKLWIQGLMSKEQLSVFYFHVIQRGQRHRRRVEEIFRDTHGIDVEISSPFESLFSQEAILGADDLLRVLGMETSPLFTKEPKKITKLERKHAETFLTQRILGLLTSSPEAKEAFSLHQRVWKDLWEASRGRQKIDDLESLFKAANAMMIALAAVQGGLKGQRVCSILPSNEKPIAVKYANYQPLLNADGKNCYSDVLALTVLEELICHSLLAPGNTYYLRNHTQEVNSYNRELLSVASLNLPFFAKAEGPIERLGALDQRITTRLRHGSGEYYEASSDEEYKTKTDVVSGSRPGPSSPRAGGF